MTPQEAADRLEIQETLTAYSTALDVPGRRWDDWERCFAPEATCDFSHGDDPLPPDMPYGELRELFRQNDAIRISSQHLLLNFSVTVTGDTATARTECVVISFSRTGSSDTIDQNVASVWYDDEFIRTDAGWRIRHRICRPRWGARKEVPATAVQLYL